MTQPDSSYGQPAPGVGAQGMPPAPATASAPVRQGAMPQSPPPQGTRRKTLGESTAQRTITWILLGFSVVGLAVALTFPPRPLAYLLSGASGQDSRTVIMITAVAFGINILVFIATWVITIMLLVKRRVAFYVPLAGGAVAVAAMAFSNVSAVLGF